jgi:hypothetical protein
VADPPRLERLTTDHRPLLETFACSKPTAEHLVQFLQERALAEQEKLCSSTFVLLSPDRKRIDAYVTLSAAQLKLPQRVRNKKEIPRSEVPALLLGYIAVHDDAGRGVGRQIFDWVKLEAFRLNALAGCRLVWLEVEAANWEAFRIYANKWGLVAVPLKDPKDPTGPNVRTPQADQIKRPANIGAEERIGMYFDILGEFGPWPTGGLPGKGG